MYIPENMTGNLVITANMVKITENSSRRSSPKKQWETIKTVRNSIDSSELVAEFKNLFSPEMISIIVNGYDFYITV